MLQLGVIFFNVEIIHGFTVTFVAICSDTSYPFGFTYIIKLTPLEILKFLVTTVRNKDKKVAYFSSSVLIRSTGNIFLIYEGM